MTISAISRPSLAPTDAGSVDTQDIQELWGRSVFAVEILGVAQGAVI
jgi:hypothetical protein